VQAVAVTQVMWLARLEARAMRLRCDYCGRRMGQWCTTASGREASYLHGARTNEARAQLIAEGCGPEGSE
jgi:hypothetical protein